jgi:erythromycin esterase
MNALLLAAALLIPTVSREVTLAKNATHRYEVQLRRGESAEIVVEQKGVDVIVDVHDPRGRLLDSVDGPTGRAGEERVEIIATSGGRYAVTVKPFDANEPEGAYAIRLSALHSATKTAAILRARQEARDAATEWLRAYATAVPASGVIPANLPLPHFDALAGRARVLAIGEATHGSREFGDVRLSLTRRLVERHGFRVVALEASAANLAAEDPAASAGGWIGVRTQRELTDWLRAWNDAHPTDRVTLIGLDSQDNARSRSIAGAFISKAYGAQAAERWKAAEAELAAADEQSAVFGNSAVKLETRNHVLQLRGMIELDAPLLRARFGEAELNAARDAITNLAQFADFNSGAADGIGHSRDWTMAANLMRALDTAGPASRAVFWSHNAHIAAPRATQRTAGSILRNLLGCAYASLALTFREGSFLAQLPDRRIEISSLPPSPPESIEGVLAPLTTTTATLIAWPCDVDLASVPEWLRTPRPLHWVGALFTPGTAPSAAFRPFNLTQDFDAILSIPRVTAEDPFRSAVAKPPL